MHLCFLFSLLLVLLCPVHDAAGFGPEAGRVAVHSVQADFTQEKHLKILARPLVSHGRFLFQAPQSLRWEYTSPVPSVVLMHGGAVRKFVQRGGRMAEEQSTGFDFMQFVLGEIRGWLGGNFAENKIFTASFPDDDTVLLSPREEGIAAFISAIELKLAGRSGLLERVTIIEGPDSSTVLRFTNGLLNQDIPASTFMQQ